MRFKKQLSTTETQSGEYLPADHLNQPPIKSSRTGFLHKLFSPFIWAFIMILLVFVLLMFGRQWYDSLLVRLDQNKTVHVDESTIKTGIRSQVRPQVTLVYTDQAGQKVRVLADAQEYSAFVNEQATLLETAKTQLLAQIQDKLRQQLALVFDGMHARVDRFADWYFAYPTTYKILWEATTSATRHVFSVEATDLSKAVSYDVEQYLHQHYENIVLRPEITDSQLQAAYYQTLQSAHERYVNVLSNLKMDFQRFVAQYTSHLETPKADQIEMVLDWDSQFNKVNMADYEKGPKGAALGAALTAGGAFVGKTVAGAAGKGVAGQAVASAAGKGLFAKLSAPFVSKAVLVGAGGAVGSLGGPLGTVIGALGGLGVDYALNEGVELTQRETFVTDVNEAVTTTQMEWEKTMQQSLQEAIQIWLDDTIQLLPRYKS